MPTYDYYCPANERTLEVWHSMGEKLATWGEVCARTALDPGDTPPDSPVERRITGGTFISGKKNEAAAPMPAGVCCKGRCGCA